MSDDFHDVQRIVLCGTRWKAARHLMLEFGDRSPLHFLHGLRARGWPTAANAPEPEVQVSLGITRRGLERAAVPDHVLARFTLKSPAYWAGAALRAAGHLGMSDRNAPEHWDPRFANETLDAVLSVHATDDDQLDKVVTEVKGTLGDGLSCTELPPAAALPAPPGTTLSKGKQKRGQWVHFGLLDGLSRIGIKGWTLPDSLQRCLPTSRHEAGEFLLGREQDCGANPWVAGPGQLVWPDQVRDFFRNGSFGVLQQIQQDVGEFERFVKSTAEGSGLSAHEVKGKLCGRYPDGRSLAVPDHADPASDFDYTTDPKGHGCPFGSHVRRMNPRLHSANDPSSNDKSLQDNRPAHFGRSRPLLRRGMPYGPPWQAQEFEDKGPRRGLIGQFFCASIEDQFEHLQGEWAERVPLGSPDGGGARDPLIGAHESGDGPFEIPRAGAPALRLDGLRPFTRTIGTAYLFYPSLTTLAGIADSSPWGLADEGDDQ